MIHWTRSDRDNTSGEGRVRYIDDGMGLGFLGSHFAGFIFIEGGGCRLRCMYIIGKV